MASPTYVGAGAVLNKPTNTTNVSSVAPPAGHAAGDLLVIVANIYTAGVTLPTPAGWTVIADSGAWGTSSLLHSYLFWKIAATASEPSVTLTTSGNSYLDGQMFAFRGVNTTTPINASAGYGTVSSSNPVTTAAITTTAADTLLVYVGVDATNASWDTPPAGATERVEIPQFVVKMVLATEPRAAVGTEAADVYMRSGGASALARTAVFAIASGAAAAVTPVADFTGTPLAGDYPLSVAFTDTSTNTPTSWAWTFGDGGTSTVKNPTRSYAAAGTYTVALVATNSAGSNTKTRVGYVTVTVPQPQGVCIAFGDNWDVPNPTWTRIDNVAGRRVRGYTIDRGRPNEFEKTGTGTATIRIADTIGTFDPTDPAAVSNVAPGRQACINLLNPTNGTWHTIFRGYVESWRYVLDQTRQLMDIELTLTDGFAILSRYELQVGVDGAVPPFDPLVYSPAQIAQFTKAAKGNVLYGETVAVSGQPTSGTVGDRILSVLKDAGWPYDLATNWIGFPAGTIPDIFSGNVRVGPKAYAPGTSALDALWDAADAEFPGVSNIWCARDGHLRFRGRQARFRPTVAQYGIVHWNVGDPSFMASTYHGPPLFSGEGPAFYAAAYAHNSPFSQGSPFKTTLTAPQETAFLAWVTANGVPWVNEDPSDYDMRGFYKASVIDNTIPDWTGPGAHFPDTYKTPYDTSFSKQSQYATVTCPFDWVVDAIWGDLLIDFRDNSIVFGPPKAGYVVPISELEWSNGEDNLYNSCTATPQGVGTGTAWRQLNPDPPNNDNVAGQLVQDTGSIAAYGLRGLMFDNLQTIAGKETTPNNSMVETKLYATYYVQNYKDPHPRISRIVFKARRPAAQNAGAVWELLSNAEISDLLTVKTDHPGAGGFNADFFVEGIHYVVTPGPPEHAVVELTLDVSPRAHWTTNPFTGDP